MSQRLLLIATLAILATACRSAPLPQPNVRVTLDDGQVLLGTLSTKSFALETGLGRLDFDTADAGELGLVSGKNVKQSGQRIKLWLRNGSEFVGKWQKPQVDLKLLAGGQSFDIQVPVAKLRRLQFRGKAVWSQDAVFRIRTRFGDDFFVDVTKNRLSFDSDFGAISPYLSEITRLEPLDKKNKRFQIYLENGSVIKASFTQDVLDLKLAMGPERIRLPLSAISTMNRQYVPYQGGSSSIMSAGARATEDSSAQQTQSLDMEKGADRSFYSNKLQQRAKKQASQGFKVQK